MSIQKVSFTGNVASSVSKARDLGPEVKNYLKQKEAEKELLKSMPKAVRVLNKMKGLLGGEVTNICINALGTGLIAPIFIKYNFLSKTDSDTRTYSAWRQPVSAVLSVATTVGVLTPINRWMNRLSNEGKLFSFDMFNQGGLQDAGYLKKRVKKANPGATKKELTPLIEAEQNRQRQALIESIKENNTIKFVDKTGRTVVMPKEKFQELVTGILKENADKYIAEIERYKGEKLERQTSSAVYKFEHAERVNQFLENAKAKATEFKKDTNGMQKWLKSEIKTMKANKSNQELVNIATDISKRLDMATINNKIDSISDQVQHYSSLGSKKAVKAEINSNIEEQVKVAQEHLKEVKEIKGKIEKGKTVSKVLEGLGENHPLKKTLVMDIIDKYSGNLGKRMTAWKALSGLVISIAILPVACDLLNRLYPAFMDTFFPGLSKKKKSGNPDQQKVADKNAQEVNK